MVFVYVCFSYIKRCLFANVKLWFLVGMTKQISDGKDLDNELLTLDNHVDLTSFSRHHFSWVNNSLCLPLYHLTFV